MTDLSDANIRNRLKLSLRRSSTKEELFVADQTTPDQQQLEEEAKQAAAREAEEEGRRIAAELEAQRIEQERILFERQLEEERILREQREAQRLEEERILQEKQELERLEQERIAREKEERERLEEEKKLLQMKLLEAEKNKSVLLSGFVSVQPSTSPVSFLHHLTSCILIYYSSSFGNADTLFFRAKVWRFITTNYKPIQSSCLI